VNRICSAVAPLALLLVAGPAYAGTVAIVQPPSPTPGVTETVSRIHGELLSVGLDVKVLRPPADGVPSAAEFQPWIERIAAEGGIDAVIDVVGDAAPAGVDVWIIDKSSRKLELSKVVSEPNTASASERLAIRAIEVLRSSFLVSEMSSRKAPTKSAEPTKVERPAPREPMPERRPERVGIAVGGAVLTSLDRLGPAILPVLRLDGALRAWLVVTGEFAGFGSRPQVATTAGNARIDQQYGIVGAGYRFRGEQGLAPFIAFSTGALRTSVQGAAAEPSLGHTLTQWSFLLDSSVGASLHLPGRYTLTVAAHAQLAEPYVAVHILDTIAATSGRPNLVFTLTLGAWL